MKGIGVSCTKDNGIDVALDTSVFEFCCALIRYQCNKGRVVARI